MATTVTVSRRAGTTYAVDIATDNHQWISDEPARVGGEGLGPTPTQLLLSALGSCSAITVEMYARRKGWDLQGATVNVTYHREDQPLDGGGTKPTHHFRQELTFSGDLDAAQEARLVEIAGRCPIHRMLESEKMMTDVSVENVPVTSVPVSAT